MTDNFSEGQLRYRQLDQAGFEMDEILHAIGRTKGGLLRLNGLTRQEQQAELRKYVEGGMTEEEARRVLAPPTANSHRPVGKGQARVKAHPALDWMPAQQARNQVFPGRSRRGLMK